MVDPASVLGNRTNETCNPSASHITSPCPLTDRLERGSCTLSAPYLAGENSQDVPDTFPALVLCRQVLPGLIEAFWLVAGINVLLLVFICLLACSDPEVQQELHFLTPEECQVGGHCFSVQGD
eukprot:3409249-Lingulodinium_polyedra.AAC.1